MAAEDCAVLDSRRPGQPGTAASTREPFDARMRLPTPGSLALRRLSPVVPRPPPNLVGRLPLQAATRTAANADSGREVARSSNLGTSFGHGACRARIVVAASVLPAARRDGGGAPDQSAMMDPCQCARSPVGATAGRCALR